PRPRRLGDRALCAGRRRAGRSPRRVDRAELSRRRAEEDPEGIRRRAGEAGWETAMSRPPRSHDRGPQQRGRSFAPRSPAERRPDALWIYGIHPALAVLATPQRTVKRIVAPPNARARVSAAGARLPVDAEEATPRHLDHLLGGEAVHQGIA